jgi:hypothetical protein
MLAGGVHDPLEELLDSLELLVVEGARKLLFAYRGYLLEVVPPITAVQLAMEEIYERRAKMVALG